MKKFLHTAFFAVLIFMLISVNAFAEFSDMPSGEDGDCLQRAVNNGLLTGYEDGTIRPGNPIKRSEMAAIMVRALGAKNMADISSYTDVSVSSWYHDDMAKAVEMEAFKGSSPQTLNPESEITRQEALIVLSRVFSLPSQNISVLERYTDSDSVSEWAREEVSKVVGGNYLPEIQLLRPLDNMTRLEFAQIMDKLVSFYITESGVYTPENMPQGNILVKADNVSFKGVSNDKTIYIGDGVKSQTVVSDSDLSYIIIRGGNLVFNSGKCYYARAIGKNTKITLTQNAMEFLKPYENGKYGSFYARPGYGEIHLSSLKVEID